MFYREAGDFKTSYQSDQATFTIKLDKILFWGFMAFATFVVPFFVNEYWEKSGFLPSPKRNQWYKNVGSGMGRTIGIAIALGAYTLSDEGTWIAFRRNESHRVLFSGDTSLVNQYSIILVNPKKHKHVNEKDGQIFIDWMLGQEGQKAISGFQVNGKQLFYPNAKLGPKYSN